MRSFDAMMCLSNVADEITKCVMAIQIAHKEDTLDAARLIVADRIVELENELHEIHQELEHEKFSQ